jgi:hypothetical protein
VLVTIEQAAWHLAPIDKPALFASDQLYVATLTAPATKADVLVLAYNGSKAAITSVSQSLLMPQYSAPASARFGPQKAFCGTIAIADTRRTRSAESALVALLLKRSVAQVGSAGFMDPAYSSRFSFHGGSRHPFGGTGVRASTS